MAINTVPIIFNSKEELLKNLEKVVEDYKGLGVSVIRGLKLSKDEQRDLVQTLGDIMNWYPNSQSGETLHKYLENHSSNGGLPGSTNDQVILDWHIEHVDYDGYVPLIGGVWNMLKFECDSESGKTYFFDSNVAYEMLEPQEKDFLNKCYLSWYDINNSGPHYAPAIAPHWLSGKPLIRIEITKGVTPSIDKFDGRNPTEEESQEFLRIKEKLHQIIDHSEEKRIIHRWQEGDVVIPDLHRMAHAVTGGFLPSEREFNGYWLFAKNPEGRKQDDMPLVWRDAWQEGLASNEKV